MLSSPFTLDTPPPSLCPPPFRLCSPQRPQIPKQTKRQSDKLCELAPRQTGKWQKYPLLRPLPAALWPLLPPVVTSVWTTTGGATKAKDSREISDHLPTVPCSLASSAVANDFLLLLCSVLRYFAISKRNARATCECYLAKAARATQSNQELVQYLRERIQ